VIHPSLGRRSPERRGYVIYRSSGPTPASPGRDHYLDGPSWETTCVDKASLRKGAAVKKVGRHKGL